MVDNSFYDLTATQAGMLFHSLYAPESGVYLLQIVGSLHEQLDISRFEQAWQQVIETHSVLRVGYVFDEQQKRQQSIQTNVVLEILRVDDNTDEHPLQAYLKRDRHTPFDFSRAPLMRLALFSFGQADFRFVWSFHHSILDGRSFTQILREVFSIYQHNQTDWPQPAADLFPVYLRWHQQQSWDETRAYWQQTLSGFTSATEIPGKIGGVGGGIQKAEKFSLSPQTVAALRKIASTHNLTLSTFVLAAWGLLLMRYSGETDVVFGAARAGRHVPGLPHDQIQNAVGLFINTLPIRVNAKLTRPALALLKDLRANWLALREGLREHTPLSKIQEWSDVPPGTSLFDSIVVYENYLLNDLLQNQGPDWQQREFELFEQTNYALSLMAYETKADALLFKLQYDTNEIDESLVQHLCVQLQILLQSFTQLAQKENIWLGDLAWMDADELTLALAQSSEPALGPQAECCIHQLFEQQVERSPDATALIFQQARLTYRELNEQSNRLAYYLRTAGVGPDVLVGVCLERSPEMIITLLAILKAGGGYVPLDPAHPQQRLEMICHDARLRLIVSQPSLQNRLPNISGCEVIFLPQPNATQPVTNLINLTALDHLAYVLFTSGTTGRPKGVAIQHQNTLALLSWAKSIFSVAEMQGMLASTSIGFDLSVFEIFAPLTLGGCVILAVNVLELPSLPAAGQVTLVNSVPSAISELLRVGNLPASVSTLVLAGEPLSASLVDKLYETGSVKRVMDAYGPTENTTYATYTTRQLGKPAHIGRPLPGWTVYILDALKNLVPAGVLGEAYIGGVGVARGYFNRPDLSAERFVPDPFLGKPGARMYRTGDLMRRLPQGEIEFLGRIDHQIKLRGFRIELGEIDAALASHPAVHSALTLLKGTAEDQKLVVYVVLRAETPETESNLKQQLKAYLTKKLPEYMLPAAMIVIPQIPLTANGKLDRSKLPEPDFDLQVGPSSVAPRDALEQQIADLWCEVLRIEKVGVTDHFYALGGHSLLMTQVVARIQKSLNVQIALSQFFYARTIAEQALIVRSAQAISDVHGIVKAAPDIAKVVSFGQQQLLLLEKMLEDSPYYNIPLVFKFDGVLDLAVLQASFNELIARHEILRTVFALDAADQFVQIILPQLEITIDSFAIEQSLPDAQKFDLACQQASRFAQIPFDLAAGPLLRARVFTFSAQSSLLVLCLHHSISDGSSESIILHELAALYSARKQNHLHGLKALEIQYADFAIWQRAHLTDAALQPELTYWVKQLAAAPASLQLAADFPRPQVQSFRGKTSPFQIPPALREDVKALARQLDVSLFTFLLTAYHILLFIHSGQPDVLVGTPVAGRNRVEVENMIGLFVNTLVIRANLSRALTFRQLLQQVDRTTLDAFANQALPFEKLVQALAPERNPGWTPLFQQMFVLQNMPTRRIDLPGGSLTPLVSETLIEKGTANFDLTLSITETDQGLAALFEYSSDLFLPGIVETMAAHYQNILKIVTQQPDLKIGEMDVLTPSERATLLRWGGAGQAPSLAPQSVLQKIEEQARQNPSALALLAADRQMTYAALDGFANQLAQRLIEMGCRAETRVGICLHRSPEMLPALLGVLKAGGTYIPLDPDYPLERLRYIAEDARLTCVITGADTDALFAGLLPTLRLDSVLQATAPGIKPVIPIFFEQLAYIIYTSGTSGKPKGVGVPHGALNHFVAQAQTLYNLGAADRVLQFASISFDAAAEEIYPILCSGGTLVLRSDEMLASADAFLTACAALDISVLDLPTSFWQLLMSQDNPHWPPRLRLTIIGGEAVQSEPVERWRKANAHTQAQLFNTYGPTETTIVATWADLSQPGPLSIGIPLQGLTAYVLNDSAQLLPPGVPGELYLGGAQLARGYINNPALTAEKFVPNPFLGKDVEEDRRRWTVDREIDIHRPPSTVYGRLYRTGDLVRWLPNGTLEYLGRVDAQVKLRGFRIELGEIEALVASHPDVREVAVLLREDRPGDPALTAYLVTDSDAVELEKDLRQKLKQQLPAYMLPAFFVSLSHLPLTLNGKLDRKQLPAPASEVFAVAPKLTPRTQTEQQLSQIWAEVLGTPEISMDDDFFDLGGHSLSLMQVSGRIQKVFGVSLPLRKLFEFPRLADLAAQIDLLIPLQRAQQNEEASHPENFVLHPRPRTGPIPLSFAQQRLWFLNQLEGSSATYNIPCAYRLRGKLDSAALEAAFQRLLARHEILRTHFESVDGQPQQVIDPAPVWRLNMQPASADPESDLRRAANLPFDLSQAPLIRAYLWRHSAEEHTLLIVTHHIISDGWSQSIFERELSLAYHQQDLPALNLHYADYVLWQREWLAAGVLETQLTFWKQTLDGAPALLELPTDHPRPAKQSYRGSSLRFELDAALWERLGQLARENQSTLFMLLLSAFALLLQRYSRQHDIVIGTPVANRQPRETEGMLGFFVNTLPLRVDLSGDPTFRQLLSRVRQMSLAAFTHCDIPFEKLVEELHPQRSLSHAPILQVMFGLQTDAPAALTLAGLQIENLPISSDTSKFDLSLSMEGQRGIFEFNTDLFASATIRAMSEHFKVLLAAVLDGDPKTSALPMLTAAEQAQLQAWNQTSQPYSSAFVHQVFEQQAARTPEAVAVAFGESRLTYRELNQRANPLARHLQTLGVGPDVLVGICLERSLEMVIALLAVFKAGGAYLPMDPAYPQERIQQMSADSGLQVLLTCQNMLSRFSFAATIVDMDGLPDWPDADDVPMPAIKPDHLAYVIYTSGSTGRPKGAMLTHRALANHMQWLQSSFPLKADDRILQKTPFSFDASVWEFWAPLMNGATLVMAPPEIHRDPHLLVDLIAGEQITVIQFVPSLLRMVLDEVKITSCPALRLIFCGGEALTAELVDKAHQVTTAQLCNLYGPTETCIDSTYWHASSRSDSAIIPIGKPVANLQNYILDSAQNKLPVGIPGELYIAGVQVGRGYLNRPELTAARFVPDPFCTAAGGRMYRTGDLARWLPDGNIEYLGRIDHQVKLRGFRIELGEIEAVLGEDARVHEAVVLLREDRPRDQALVAYLAAAPTPHLEGELRQRLKQHLPEYMIPALFVFLEHLPLTPNGKLDRKALPAPQVQIDLSYTAPRSGLEEMLETIWQEILGQAQVSVHANFFDLGGHSLLAIQVVSRIWNVTNLRVPLQVFFEYPTIAELSAWMNTQVAEDAPPAPLQQTVRGVKIPLSFAQQRLWFLDQLEGGSATYNIPSAYRLDGRLDVVALEKAFQQLLARHEVLRTSFESVDGEPVQIIAPTVAWQLDIQPGAADLLSFANIPFDLTQPPLMRAHLWRNGPEEHTLLINIHHIISDGWSQAIFERELALAYNQAELPAPSLQYADYAIWQREWIRHGVLESQLAFWKKTLEGASPLLELPLDHPRPAKQSYRGATLPFEQSAALSDQLHALARANQSTLFMVLFSAFAVLLQRYSRQSDLVIGTPVANRQHTEVEGMLGFFVNTLPLRVDLSGNPTFSQLLSRVRQLSIAAFTHQDVPFEKLVEELHPQRTLSYSPIFQVMFVLQNRTDSALTLTDLKTTHLALHHDAAKFDLSLSIEAQSAGLSGALQFNTDLFEPATMQRMIGQLTVLLEAIVNNSQQAIHALPLLTAGELRELQSWNEPRSHHRQDVFAHQLFEQQAARTPETIAVVFEDSHLTYRQLDERANRLANHLQTLGVGPDSLVGICLERSLEMIVALLGVLKAGGAYVPLDPQYPQERLTFTLNDAQISILLTQESLLAQLPQYSRHIICLDRDWSLIAQESPVRPALVLLPANLAYVIYTSGSTGKPKGVMIDHANLTRLFSATDHWFSFGPHDVWTMFHSFAFDFSVWEIWGALVYGGRLVIVPQMTARSPQAFYALLCSAGVTVLNQTPGAFRQLMLAQTESAQAHWLRLVIFGGEALETAALRGWYQDPRNHQAQLINMYGITETTVHVTYQPLEIADTEKAAASPIGRSIPDLQSYLLDPYGQPVPIGVTGELYVGGSGVARGYLERPSLTAERFVPDPFCREPGARLYRSGDLARWLPDGRLEYVGRIDHQVKLRGFRIELGEIEAILGNHPAVHQAVVLLREDQPGDKYLAAYLVAAHTNLLEVELRDSLKERLPHYMIPSAFAFIDALPLTANGKLDRKALPIPTKGLRSLMFAAPRNDLEQKIVSIWQKVLGVPQIGIDDNFFNAGGDSLKTIYVVHHLEHACTVMDIFTHQTVRELAAYLASQQGLAIENRSNLLYELTPHSQHNKILTLVCVPAAGGNAIVYKELADQLPVGYALYALEMPAHDSRHHDEKLLPWSVLAPRCVAEIKQKITGPIALYGHSAGVSLVLELARLLEQDQIIPAGVYLGANFPHMRLSGKFFDWFNMDRLVSDRFYEDAQRMAVGSLFDEFDPKEKAIRTRSWRHDALQSQDYYTAAQSIWQGKKLQAPIVSIVGEKDRGTEFYAEEVHDWFLFAETVDLSVIPHAGHYFMKHQAKELAQIIVEKNTMFHQGMKPEAVNRPPEKTKRQHPSLSQFLIVAGGQFISTIGTIISSFALGAWIYKSTGSVTNLTGVAFFEALPFILFLPVAGAVADRWDRRKILLACDGVAMFVTLLLAALIFTGGLQIWHLWIFSTIYAVTSAFQQPAYLAGVAQLVPKRYLSQANGFVQLGQAVGNVIAPLLGGFLIETINLNGVVLLDLITYLVGFLGLAAIQFPDTLFKKEEEPVIKAIIGGWRYLLRRRGLLGLAFYFAGSNVGNSALSVLLIPYILAMGTGTLLGVALGTWGVGAVIGSVLMIIWGGLQNRAQGIIGSTIFISIFIILTGLSTTPISLCLSLLGAGFFYSLCVGHFYPLLQIKIGEELLGRILSTFRVISYSTIPLAYLIVGPLADKIFNPLTQPRGVAAILLGAPLGIGPSRGMGLILVFAGVFMIVWSGFAFLYRPLREIETDLPDAQIEAVIYDDKDILQLEADKSLR